MMNILGRVDIAIFLVIAGWRGATKYAVRQGQVVVFDVALAALLGRRKKGVDLGH